MTGLPIALTVAVSETVPTRHETPDVADLIHARLLLDWQHARKARR